ncbi:MAG: ferrous iron transport protein B [Deltaproteobacteria bacterium GWA2_65_63]|nr:MAG: ferrous iron transport protein B [Deltaproteobacteria bacterium GWA2_65_63]
MTAPTAARSFPVVETAVLRVAVAGNPNSGKSTLINSLAGTRLHVGNWPGVTVEKKEAALEHRGQRIALIDLPGTYSLSPYTEEEIIARDFLVHDRPDIIVDVVDATNLERNLYLTLQLLELGIPVIVALNIYDEAEKKGYKIDVKAMEAALGVTVVPTVATRKTGMNDLLEAVTGAIAKGSRSLPRSQSYGEDIEAAVKMLTAGIVDRHPALVERYPRRWLALKLMEGDRRVLAEANISGVDSLMKDAVGHLREAHGEDLESLMADARYSLAAGLTREVLQRPSVRKTEMTEKIDRVVLNRFLGIPIFFAAMWFVFKMTFDLSAPFADWLDGAINGPLTRWIEASTNLLHGPDWLVSLMTKGVIAGVGSVLVFVPVIFAMMFFITFLEGSGYMARAAFVMDRAMHSMGLHGKSFIPMILGFGCNVPAQSGTVLWSLYVMGIVLAVLMGILFKRTLFRGESPMFIMELPPYRMPSGRSLAIHTWEKGKHFLIKAGTYILAVSVLVWFLLNLPWGVENKKDSYLGKVGSAIAPVFAPLGFGNWEASSSLIAGVIAKEIVVGTMGEIYVRETEKKPEGPAPTFFEDLREIGTSFASAGREAFTNVISTVGITSLKAEEKEEEATLRSVVAKSFTPLSAYAFMAFVLLYMPCVVAAAAFKHEFGTWKWFGVAFVYQTILAWSVAFIVYQGGKLFGIGG